MLFDDAPMDGVTGQASEAISVASSSSHGLGQGGIQEEAGVLGWEVGAGRGMRLYKTMFNQSMMLFSLTTMSLTMTVP